MADKQFLIRTKKISLAFMGEGYEDAMFEARYISIPDNRRIQELLDSIGDDNTKALEAALEVIQQQFVSGVLPVAGGGLAPFTKDDIVQVFDAVTIMTVYGMVMGNPSPKASESSMTSTQEGVMLNHSVEQSSDTVESLASPSSNSSESQLMTSTIG